MLHDNWTTLSLFLLGKLEESPTFFSVLIDVFHSL